MIVGGRLGGAEVGAGDAGEPGVFDAVAEDVEVEEAVGGAGVEGDDLEELDLVGEVNGRIDVQGGTPVGTEDRGQARLGGRLGLGQLLGAGVRLDAGVVVGLADVDPGIGATVGLTLLDRSF